MLNWFKKRRAADHMPPMADGNPANSAALIASGSDAMRAGDIASAASLYRQAVAWNHGDAQLRLALGFALLKLKQYAEAQTHLTQAILLEPRSANAYYLLGKVAHEQGNFSGAIAEYNEALDIQPDLEVVFNDLATALHASGNRDAAENVLADGIAKCPASANMHFDLAALHGNLGEWDKAEVSYRKALQLKPLFFEAYSNLGIVLQHQGQTGAALGCFDRAISIKPDYLPAYGDLLWVLTFQPSQLIDRYVREAQRYGSLVLEKARPFAHQADASKSAQADQRLRVGFLSGDLRSHPVGFFLEGAINCLRPGQMELFAYSMNPQDDELTGRIRSRFARWTTLTGVSDEEAARKIHDDEIDILIDLSGHSAFNRLPVFAWKPAPVQASWLGYMASTGVPGMDYVLADRVSVTEDIKSQFTEEIWYLPETVFCFTPPPESAKLQVTTAPVQWRGHITFGSYQRMNKLSDDTLALWAAVLNALPRARLCLRNLFTSAPAQRHALLSKLEIAGIAGDRVTLEPGVENREDYLATYAGVDVVLDTYPHPGVTTTCEAMWMGVPTITLCGNTMLSRVGASLLTCAGLADWVAHSEEDYVEMAVRKALDVEGLTRLRAGLRAQVSQTALFDANRFAPQLEEALMGMWRRKMGPAA